MVTARNPAQRAFADWRTILAARSGVRSFRCADGGAAKRSAGTGADDGRGAGRRSSGGRPGWSVIGLLGGQAGGRRTGSDAAGGRAWRDDPGLPDGDGQRAQRELAGVDGEDPVGVDLHAEAVHAAGGGTPLGPGDLDPEAVVPGSV